MKSLNVAVFLGFKSIVRGNIGVTLLTIAMLILSNLNLLFVPSLVNGIVISANNKLISTYSSNIIVEDRSDNHVIKDISQLVAQIEAIQGVTAVTYRSTLGAELDFEEERTNCTIRGIPPERDKKVFGIASAMFEGSYLDPNDSDQILLGLQLAGADQKNLELYSGSLKKVHAGDKIWVTYGTGIKKQYRVKGIFFAEFIQTDLQAFVSEREFRSINPLMNNRASVVNVKLYNDADSPHVVREIAKLRDNLQFKTWQDTAGIIQSMTDSFNIINGILMMVNLLVAGITVFIVTYIDLANKRRQIGIERAIGITAQAITLSYIFRAVFYAILGSFFSYLLYTYAVVPLELEHPFRFPFGDVALFISNAQIIRSALIVIGVATVAALLPVLQTIRIRLLDAIWG